MCQDLERHIRGIGAPTYIPGNGLDGRFLLEEECSPKGFLVDILNSYPQSQSGSCRKVQLVEGGIYIPQARQAHLHLLTEEDKSLAPSTFPQQFM